jgi:hypothetical protein
MIRYDFDSIYNFEDLNTLWCKSEDVEKLEEQNKQLLEVLLKALSDKAELQIDYSVDTGHLHKSRHEYFDYDKFIGSITGLEIEDAYKQITGKKPEEGE